MKDAIEQQGKIADSKLKALGLILTQGGEPTFVPHDTSAPEWNTAALGPNKLLYARRLAKELVKHRFQGGVVMQSFGKQYPGEPLPRWQVNVYSSRSGNPLWNDLSKLRLDQDEVKPSHAEMPQVFILKLANALGLENTTLPVFEDLEATLKQTGSEESISLLPQFSRSKRAFVSRPLPDDAKKKYERFLKPAGWVLPLSHEKDSWLTDKWELPSHDDITLFPGDSPIGLRLPLGRLDEGTIKSGLTVEFKDDELLIFLPPVSSFAAFTELVQTIEKLVTELDLPPVRLEGYTPPGDDDMDSIALTSDPGVLEVNLPPADNWADYESMIRKLFNCAETIGMRGYKYQLSGRKVSTGGGAHIILGGPDIERNPLIEKPTILSSYLRFLKNHPSLSYAFSGLFTGPSCQAPRVDESAFELPYELEISLKAIEELPSGSPVIIDAILRNLLMDWNGNTHRAELSVDKFYNYNASNGQNGLIEFRAFEMVPEPELLLAANVLLRALAATFAEEPYKKDLVDWREALHDKFSLPYFIKEDLLKVGAYLNARGFSFPDTLFDAQFEFRFPIITEFETGKTKWILRQALETWPVMGEHQGTGRVVDSTTDRLELLVTDLPDSSNLIATVNGVKIPLVSCGENSAVAAIRYRLFDNPWGLQPHIKAHSPLIFEIIDKTKDKILYSFDYFSWKIDGSTYDNFPETEEEAQSRIQKRIKIKPNSRDPRPSFKEIAISSQAPYTLDLRRL